MQNEAVNTSQAATQHPVAVKGRYPFNGEMLTTREIREKYIPLVKSNEWVLSALRDGCTTQAELIARYTNNERKKTSKPVADHPLRGTYK